MTTSRPLEGIKVYLSGPGDRYAAVDPTPRERAVKGFHDAVRHAVLELGATVVRDRNLPGQARGYDQDKVRYLLRTCDAILAFCYGRERTGGGWATSAYVLDEVTLAIESGVQSLVLLQEAGVDLGLESDQGLKLDHERLREAVARARRIEVSPEAPDAVSRVRRLVFEACADVRPAERHIFTVIPFKDAFNEVFSVIREVLEERTRLPVRRVKDMLPDTPARDRQIIEAILEAITRAPAVVLELSERNPNCFFEAGVAVARGVPTIRLIREEEDIPFDVRGWGFIKYRDLPELRRKLEHQADRFARDEVTVERLG
jgi:hypothetical protein